MTARNPSRAKWLTNFVPHRLEMLRSPAWRAMPNPLRLIVEQLEIEHLSHGGKENGSFHVPFDQFQKCGVSRRQIAALLELGEGLGLIEVVQDADALPGPIRRKNFYRLTFHAAQGKKAPTDEWRSITADRAALLLERFRARERKSRNKGETERVQEAVV